MDIQKILEKKYSGKDGFKYSCGETYESLNWLPDNPLPKPTQSHLESLWNLVCLEEAKDKKKAAINAQRDTNVAKDEGYTINGTRYYFQKSITSQLNFINTIVSGDDIAIYGWITADNIIIDITKNDLIGICRHIQVTDSLEYIQARKRKDAVMALNSISAVEDFDITQIIL